ncbi:hypothetical protein ACLB2K_065248 [Fragaria x ananassa]
MLLLPPPVLLLLFLLFPSVQPNWAPVWPTAQFLGFLGPRYDDFIYTEPNLRFDLLTFLPCMAELASLVLDVSVDDDRSSSSSSQFYGIKENIVLHITCLQARTPWNPSPTVSTRKHASPPPTIFAFAQCHSDLSQNDCSTCFAISRTKLPKCLPSTSAGIYLDGCFLAYDGHDFSGEALHEDHKHVTCGTRYRSIYIKEGFNSKVMDVIGNVTEKAVGNEGFAVVEQRGGVESVYGLAQCWRTIGEKGCRDCLEVAGKNLRGCLPVKGHAGRVLYEVLY